MFSFPRDHGARLQAPGWRIHRCALPRAAYMPRLASIMCGPSALDPLHPTPKLSCVPLRCAFTDLNVAFCCEQDRRLMADQREASLAKTWENTPEIRARIRDPRRLVLQSSGAKGSELTAPARCDVVAKTVENARGNKIVLLPVLSSMSDNFKLPTIDALLLEVEEVHKQVLHEAATATADVYQDGWAVRRLCQLVKGRCYKKTPPKVGSCAKPVAQTPKTSSFFCCRQTPCAGP